MQYLNCTRILVWRVCTMGCVSNIPDRASHLVAQNMKAIKSECNDPVKILTAIDTPSGN